MSWIPLELLETTHTHTFEHELEHGGAARAFG